MLSGKGSSSTWEPLLHSKRSQRREYLHIFTQPRPRVSGLGDPRWRRLRPGTLVQPKSSDKMLQESWSILSRDIR